MSQRRTLTYPSADGRHTIRAVEWLPDGTPRGVLQIVHGIAEHMGRYAHVAEFFTRRGYVVCGEDHLGHGATVTDGKYGFFAPEGGWDLVARDVYALRRLEGERWPDLPYVLLGHSMGSFLARTCLIRWPGTVDAAVLSGTGQERAALVAFGRVVSGLLCRWRGPDYVSPLVYALSLGAYNARVHPAPGQGDWTTRDSEMAAGRKQDPLCNFRPTVSMFRDMLGGIAWIGREENVRRMDGDMPIYLFSGDRDPVGDMGAGVRRVAALFRRCSCRDVTVRLYPGGRHEMLNERNKDEVYADVLSWLDEHTGKK